jgi:hypothetical protein
LAQKTDKPGINSEIDGEKWLLADR